MSTAKVTEDVKRADEPEKVMVANSKTGGSRKFHVDCDCRYVTDGHREWDYDMALAWGWEACEKCSAYLK